jgi:hypothetical protein
MNSQRDNQVSAAAKNPQTTNGNQATSQGGGEKELHSPDFIADGRKELKGNLKNTINVDNKD